VGKPFNRNNALGKPNALFDEWKSPSYFNLQDHRFGDFHCQG